MQMAAKKKPTAVTQVPDVLGAAGREKAQDDTVATLLSQYQRERAQLRAVQQINKHKGADAMPGVMPAKTYDERAAELGKLEQDVLDAFPDAVERVRKVVEQAAALA
jgi:hypothetical protein